MNVGDTFGTLTVTSIAYRQRRDGTQGAPLLVDVRCKCGVEKTLSVSTLTRRRSPQRSCGTKGCKKKGPSQPKRVKSEREACSDERVQLEAIKAAMTLRFGENAVSYDPSDPEANKRSQAEGRPVVYGGSLSAAEWENVRRAGALPAAGTVTPSPKPYSPNGDPLDVVPEAEWTTGMRQIVNYAMAVGQELLGLHVHVAIAREPKWPYGATYGKGRLVFNLSRCGRRFFEQGISNDVNRLLIHEFAHHYESDHLSERYYDALADLGARLARLALDTPDLFRI